MPVPLRPRCSPWGLALLLALLLPWAGAAAAEGGGRPVRMIVPFGAGGSTDVVARLLAEAAGRAEPRLALVVENRAGAAGLIGTEACARAAPDGQAICLGTTTTHAILPLLHEGRGIAAAAFAPVLLLGTQPHAVAVHPSVPARGLAEFLAWLRQSPGRSFATSGLGTVSQLVGAHLEHALGTEMLHVAYRSGEASSAAAAAGEVQVTINQVVSILPHARGGRLVPIAVTGAARLPGLPGVPALAEALGPELALTSYVAVFAPAGTPPAALRRIGAGFAAAMAAPGLRQRLEELGVEPATLPEGELPGFLAAEQARWQAILRTPRAGGE